MLKRAHFIIVFCACKHKKKNFFLLLANIMIINI